MVSAICGKQLSPVSVRDPVLLQQFERRGGKWDLCEAGTIQMSLFDKHDFAEVTSEDLPDERLIVCRNPALAEERARKRNELLQATENKLEPIRLATERTRKPLRGEQAISLRVGKVIGKHKMAKHFDLTITETSFTYTRNEERIHQEAALDGLYVVRSSVDKQRMNSERVVETYKGSWPIWTRTRYLVSGTARLVSEAYFL